ncbi:hypothetical protein ECC37_03515 [Helicobacter pylori]|nr:hypothetical protein [Helicobacter pylori]RVY64587.1 hypothetical protein ECC37_03515 [Helicobacter pylori]WQX97545.1 hypothetical protein KVM89_03420 [Helicobacter pylori]
MLENMQNISLQSSHEAGVDITESKMLIKFAPLLLMNLYEYVGNGKDSKEAFDQAMKDAKDVVLIKLLEVYQNQFKEVFERYFHETTKFFNQSFDELWRASYTGDADLGIGINNKIQERLGQKALFDNSKEGWDFITSRGRTEI